jgi:4-amino-4-deoxy-L-arabinose transferase-like glycosyltransferase
MIFGSINLAIRIPSITITVVTSFFVYDIIHYFSKDEKKSFWGLALFNFLPIFSMGAIMTLPDTPLMFFYSLALWLFVKIIFENKGRYWYYLGVVVGLGFLSKYNMVLVYPSVFFFLVFSKEDRHWLKRKEPYIAFLISLLFFIPVILWNKNNDWSSFAFHLKDRQKKTFRFRPKYFFRFLLAQLLVASPVLFYAFWSDLVKNYKKREVKLLAWFSLPIFIIFGISSLSNASKIHWTAMAFIPMIIISALYKSWKPKFEKVAIGFAVVLTVLIYIQALYPLIPMEDDITNDMYGWEKAGAAVSQMLDEDSNYFLFSNRYQTTSQLSFYLPNKEYVYSLNTRTEMFDFWEDEDKLIGKNGIFVTQTFYEVNPEKLYDFDKIELVKTIPIYRGGKLAREYFIYKCYNYKGLKKK